MAQSLGDSMLLLAGALAIIGIAFGSVLRMRLAILAAGLAVLFHFAFIDWNLAGFSLASIFVIVSGVRLSSVIRHARAGAVLDHERELFQQVMQVEDPARQQRLRDVLHWQDVASGEVLMQQGDKAPPLIYIAQGTATIAHDGKPIGTCSAGDFLGEMSVVSGEQASATVTAGEGMRIAKFHRAALAEMVRHVPELGRAIDGALNRSLASKLLRMNQGTGSGSADE
ncbi:MAG TPA: hypothetical protein DCS24_00935 [Erythrobacter sp.]|nr:hypothetical protein [Erythrobacter sp.]